MLLDVKNIDVLYDDFQVIWDVSINVNKAEMVALLGPNGSGKSTVLNTISNLVEHKKGSITFDNTLISKYENCFLTPSSIFLISFCSSLQVFLKRL